MIPLQRIAQPQVLCPPFEALRRATDRNQRRAKRASESTRRGTTGLYAAGTNLPERSRWLYGSGDFDSKDSSASLAY